MHLTLKRMWKRVLGGTRSVNAMGRPKKVRTAEEEATNREARLVAMWEKRRQRQADPTYLAREAKANMCRLRKYLEYANRERARIAAKHQQLHQNPAVREAKYERCRAHASTGGASTRFQHEFLSLEFGHSCWVCDQLWFDSNLSMLNTVRSVEKHAQGMCVLRDIFPEASDHDEMRLCRTCWETVLRGKVPQFSMTNGFK